ncbi:MAG: hypothetical protein AAGG51_26780 [Cyanobacteria bacterium P01_G01_bin.54]
MTADATTTDVITADAMTAELLHQAKQGDAQAIATLLNRQLAPRGLRIQTKRKDAVLALLIDSNPVPTQARLLPYLEQSFKKLASPQIERVRVYGRAHDQEKPTWMAEIDLAVRDAVIPVDRPPSPPQAVAQLPTQPFVRQWLLLNGIAILAIWIMGISSESLLGETRWLNQGLVALLGTIVYSGAQTYGLARRMDNAHEWWLVSVIPIGLLFWVTKPLQVLTVSTLLAVQCWVLKPHSDRVYWWFLGNVLGLIGVGFVIALLQSFGLQHFGPFSLILGVLGIGSVWGALWDGLIQLVFLTGVTGVQGLLLEALLRPLPDRPVLPPEAYFRTTIAQFSQQFWQTVQHLRQRLQPSPLKHPKPTTVKTHHDNQTRR